MVNISYMVSVKVQYREIPQKQFDSLSKEKKQFQVLIWTVNGMLNMNVTTVTQKLLGKKFSQNFFFHKSFLYTAILIMFPYPFQVLKV